MKAYLLAALFCLGARVFAAEPRLVAPDERKHLVLDSRVIVSASTARLVRVRALDRDGAVLAESEPITANVTDAPVRWPRGVFAAPKGRPVKFRIELSNAKLFALGGVTLNDTKPP